MDFNQQIITETAGETEKFGLSIGRNIFGNNRYPKLLYLYGDLGSGKTTFTQGFAQGLGIDKRIVSPTFIIMKRYKIPKSNQMFYHIDLYRIQQSEEQSELGLEEIFNDQNSFVVVEWADRLYNFLQFKHYDIKFITKENGLRQINIFESK
jgi:tRNA threonylcarbamoyladenosine biosynthesis protein TsaE